MPDGLGGLGIAAKIAGLWPKGLSAGEGEGGCGPPYTESNDHEFEPDSGTWPGGVDASHYCRHCGVVGSMHGGGGPRPRPPGNPRVRRPSPLRSATLPQVRIGITGGAGFIGTYVAERAIITGHDVTIFDRQGNLPNSAWATRAQTFMGDVRRRSRHVRAGETCGRHHPSGRGARHPGNGEASVAGAQNQH